MTYKVQFVVETWRPISGLIGTIKRAFPSDTGYKTLQVEEIKPESLRENLK